MCHRQENCRMTIPYRVRRGIQRLLTTLGVLALISIAVLIAWLLWLSRYVIYTTEGAKLDFSLSLEYAQGEHAKPPIPGPGVNISYGNTDDLDNLPAGTLTKLSGWVVTADMLTKANFDATKAILDSLPEKSTILLDVRNVRGEAFYTTTLGRTSTNVDAQAVSALIQELVSKNHYLIARFSPWRDRWYILEDERTRVPYGLPLAGGNGSLWEDVSVRNLSHYWLNPASTGAQNHVVQIITELREMGFSEVVFSDFRFPNTDKIAFDGDKLSALNQAADTLLKASGSDSFAISFMSEQITLPEGRCRLYLDNVMASDIASVVEKLELSNPGVQVVFFTELMDTRFEDYSVMRPLELYQG